jgi:hypothetical protein
VLRAEALIAALFEWLPAVGAAVSGLALFGSPAPLVAAVRRPMTGAVVAARITEELPTPTNAAMTRIQATARIKLLQREHILKMMAAIGNPSAKRVTGLRLFAD